MAAWHQLSSVSRDLGIPVYESFVNAFYATRASRDGRPCTVKISFSHESKKNLRLVTAITSPATALYDFGSRGGGAIESCTVPCFSF